MEFVLILLAFLAVVYIVSSPLRRGRLEEIERREAAELAELEAAKESKYREIRDAEMDFRTGKLSKEDHRALDRELRGEAIQLLRRIDSIKPSGQSGGSARAPESDPDADDEAAGADSAAGDPADTPRSDARVG